MKKYGLENRTLKFSKDIIRLCKNIKIDYYNKSIIYQLIKSATSIGANYCEANGASSRKDFKNKIYICKKESKETKYWLLLLLDINNKNSKEIQELIDETQELIFIFAKIISTLNTKK